MVQKASPKSKRTGRRPEFDREAVVTGAISAFWLKGFEATTLTDLEAATGADRSTIYNSFGGKTGLYQSATAAYVESTEDILFEPLYTGTEGLADIADFLDLLAGMLGAGTNPPGCLIVNDMAAPVDHRATDRYLKSLEGGLLAALERASSLGEVDEGSTVQRSQFITAAILGVNLAHRSTANAAPANQLLSGLGSEIHSWAMEPNGS